MPKLRPRPEISGFTVLCPECGTSVPLIATRWLAVHRETGAQYAPPRTVRERCPGSFLAVGPATASLEPNRAPKVAKPAPPDLG